jgi:hypothetical protein
MVANTVMIKEFAYLLALTGSYALTTLVQIALLMLTVLVTKTAFKETALALPLHQTSDSMVVV